MSERTSPPMAFLSECNSMQAMPSPRSTSEAPELVRMTPCVTAEIGDAGVAGNGGNGDELRRSPAESRRRRRASTRLVRDAARSLSTGAPTGSPRAFMRATVSATPAASHISKGPSSQLKPARMAASMDGASSATSPMRSAAKFQSEERNGQRKAAALSLAGLFASSRRRRSGSVAAFFAISSEGSAGLAEGRYSKVERSRTRRSSLPSAPRIFL